MYSTLKLRNVAISDFNNSVMTKKTRVVTVSEESAVDCTFSFW